MRTYIVYFEIFGKKMKTTIQAYSQKEAENKVLQKITFKKIEDVTPKPNENLSNIFDDFKNIFGIK